MQFVIITEHPPELCPMSNAKIRELAREGCQADTFSGSEARASTSSQRASSVPITWFCSLWRLLISKRRGSSSSRAVSSNGARSKFTPLGPWRRRWLSSTCCPLSSSLWVGSPWPGPHGVVAADGFSRRCGNRHRQRNRFGRGFTPATSLRAREVRSGRRGTFTSAG